MDGGGGGVVPTGRLPRCGYSLRIGCRRHDDNGGPLSDDSHTGGAARVPPIFAPHKSLQNCVSYVQGVVWLVDGV
jgi:hypothetical protein